MKHVSSPTKCESTEKTQILAVRGFTYFDKSQTNPFNPGLFRT